VRAGTVGAVLVPFLAAGCALRSDVTKLRLQLDAQQLAAARADSANRANLAAIARQVQSVLDSLAAQQAMLAAFRGDLRVQLYNVEQQLVAVQELTGQSQQRLTELRTQLEQRSEQIAAQAPAAAPPVPSAAGAAPPAGPGQAAAAAPASAEPSPDQLMELGLQQLRRGSPATARTAFAEFLKAYPLHARAGDAWFFTGEAWNADQRPDSAAAAYQQVVQHFPTSGHMPAALYKLGLIAVQKGNKDEARAEFNRLVASFPLSDEAALARDQLRSLGPAAQPH